MTAAATCRACGIEPRPGARFCDACGAPIVEQPPAEYKQVTVLFADVVRSMDIAAAEGPERLREIMAELLDCSTAVVKRYGGTLSQFTGDGIMAVFGAPITLEDNAFRACLAALDIQKEVDATLKLRIGLNSGQVIAGEIGFSTGSYTTIGEQVGMAQRMESVAPPGGVMLSESTARLVENSAILGDPEMVHIKNVDTPVQARQLLAIGEHGRRLRNEARLVGRTWELNTISALLDEATGGIGCVVNIIGPAGIGKSRLVSETAAFGSARGVDVFTAYCESHTSDIPFHVVARLLRAAIGISDLDATAAQERVRDQFTDADPEDLVLLDDLLGIRDAAVPLPDIAPDARRRRLTAFVNAASLARAEPAVFVIEDVHWIDEASESMLTEFLAVIPHTPALVLITYRPEYRGALSRVSDAQTVSLRPLSDAQSSALTAQLLGGDESVGDLVAHVSARAAGNPFFIEEMVRDLAERGVVRGDPGAYQLFVDVDVGDVDVPATLQATIGARIDRLGSTAKHTLNAAAVIGGRFDDALLTALTDTLDLAPLIEAQLVEQVRFTPRAEYAFRHPLIRKVAYESQLKSDRAQSHRRLAELIETRISADENAALIAEHLEAAGDLRTAYGWHMRAGSWSTFRDITAAQTSWQRAQKVADRLPVEDPDRMSMRIESRTALAGTVWRVGGSGAADIHFDELRELCTAAGDRRSLAVGLSALVTAHAIDSHRREASRLANELINLLEDIADPTLTIALSTSTMSAKLETLEMAAALEIAQRMIDLARGDPTAGSLVFESPLAMAMAWRGVARFCLGMAGWKNDLRQATATARGFASVTRAGVMWYAYMFAVPYGVMLPDAEDLQDTSEALSSAEQSGDDLALDAARAVRGVTLLQQSGPDRDAGLELLEETCERCRNRQFSMIALQVLEILIAREKARRGDLNDAIDSARAVLASLSPSGRCTWGALATAALVEALLRRCSETDLREAQAAIDELAAVPTDPGFVLHDVWLLRLRALLAQAESDEASYRDHRDRYRKMATDLGFEGHMAWAESMP
jgi:adenylate cyclase